MHLDMQTISVVNVTVTAILGGVLVRADAAFYVAKRAGRNRVEFLGPADACRSAEFEPGLRTARRKSSTDLAGSFAGQAKSLS